MSAFDTLAPSYDDTFTNTQIGQYLRGRVHQRLLKNFKVGDHVLELGCGTGEDALFLAEQGISVTATDGSEKMLQIAREKTQHLSNVEFRQLDLDIARYVPTEDGLDVFNGVFSNFGALNCLDDWKPLAVWLADRVKSGGILGFGIMSPYCAWEFLWHTTHWKWNIALRRLRGSEFEGIAITYPTVKRITEDFSPYFKRVHVMPLGLFLPTSALFDVVQKRPRLMQRLMALEERFGNVPQLALLADHYWIEFERK
jgi:SAM-dependent methyltransferase